MTYFCPVTWSIFAYILKSVVEIKNDIMLIWCVHSVKFIKGFKVVHKFVRHIASFLIYCGKQVMGICARVSAFCEDQNGVEYCGLVWSDNNAEQGWLRRKLVSRQAGLAGVHRYITDLMLVMVLNYSKYPENSKVGSNHFLQIQLNNVTMIGIRLCITLVKERKKQLICYTIFIFFNIIY